MHRFYEFSIITIALAAISVTLLLCLEILVPGDLEAAAIETTSPELNSQRETQTATDIKTPRTSILLSESLPGKSPETNTVTEQKVTVEKNEVKNVPADGPSPTKLVELIHSLTNMSRAQNNLANLAFDARLSELAKERSEEMIRLRYFSHTSPGGCDLKCRFTSSSYSALSWGENLAESTSYQMMSQDEIAQMFMQMWLKSASHRDNLLSDKFIQQGIGIAEKDGRIVVTVVFAAL